MLNTLLSVFGFPDWADESQKALNQFVVENQDDSFLNQIQIMKILWKLSVHSTSSKQYASARDLKERYTFCPDTWLAFNNLIVCHGMVLNGIGVKMQ